MREVRKGGKNSGMLIWCVDGLSRRNYVVVLGDLNARVGAGEVEGVVGKYRMGYQVK